MRSENLSIARNYIPSLSKPTLSRRRHCHDVCGGGEGW